MELHPPKHRRSNALPILAIVAINTLTLIVARTQLWLVVYFGVMFASTGLLGLAAGLGDSPWWQRWLLAAAGALILATLVPSPGDGQDVFFALIFATTLVVGIVTSILRFCGWIIWRLRTGEPRGQLRPFRFYVRHLFRAMLTVAVLVKAGQWLGPKVPLVSVLDCGIMFSAAAAAVIGAWAALGRRPYRRCLPALVLAAAMGVLGAMYPDHANFSIFSMCVALEAAVVILALLWLRSYGYRLTIRASAATGALAPERSSASDVVELDQTGVP